MIRKVAMIYFIFLIFVFTLKAAAAETATGKACFHKHLVDAIQINKERKSKYSALTAGKSEAVSNDLILLEMRMLAYQKVFNFDRLAFPYEKHGIMLSCDSVIDMNQTPAFRGAVSEANRPFATAGTSASVLARDLPKLMGYFATGKDQEFFTELQRIHQHLDREPNTNCLYRHFIESVARAAALQSSHQQMALQKGLKDPRNVHRQMILGHLVLLPTVLYIDAKALPLNRAGIPIICDDVPRIPLPE